MNHSPKAVTFPIALALALAGGNALADRVSAEQIYAELPAEIAQDGQQFMNEEKATELRHRVNEQSPDEAQKLRKQLQTKQDGAGDQKKEQHKHQYKEKTGGPHKNQSGSFGAFSGKGPSGGNGGGGGKR